LSPLCLPFILISVEVSPVYFEEGDDVDYYEADPSLLNDYVLLDLEHKQLYYLSLSILMMLLRSSLSYLSAALLLPLKYPSWKSKVEKK